MRLRATVPLLVLLAVASRAANRAEETAFAETFALLGVDDPGPAAVEAFDERVLTAGSRFIEESYAPEVELLGDPLFAPARNQHFRVTGSLDDSLDGRGRLEHALELGEFAYHLRAEYGTRERDTFPRGTGGFRAGAGWLPREGHRVILNGGYDAWSYDGDGYRQEQQSWFSELLGVWCPRPGLTTFARLGFDEFSQRGRDELEDAELAADLGLRLFIGADDYLTVDAGIRRPGGDASLSGAFDLVNTFTLDRMIFLTTGVGLAYDGTPHLLYDGAVRLLIGPLSLISLVGSRAAEQPDAADGRFGLEGLAGGVGPRMKLSEDYYLEYSLHLAETSIAGVRGGYRRLVEPVELVLTGPDALERRRGTDRELLVLGAFVDYTLPASRWRGRLTLDYEYADPAAFRRAPLPEPVPHHAEHSCELSLSLEPLEWLGFELGGDFLGPRADGAGGEIPAQLALDVEVAFTIDDFLGVALYTRNLLEQELRSTAAAPPLSLSLGARLELVW